MFLNYEGRRLCSHRAPLEEAQRWLVGLDLEHPILVIGLGDGFHVRELLKRLSPAKKGHLKVLEPHLEFQIAFQKTPLEAHQRGLEFLTGLPKTTLFELWAQTYQFKSFVPAWAGREKKLQFFSELYLAQCETGRLWMKEFSCAHSFQRGQDLVQVLSGVPS